MNVSTSNKNVQIIPKEDPGLEGSCYLPECKSIPFIMEFRPPVSYNGSFCIDWLRDDYKDTALDYKSLVNEYEELEVLTTLERKYFIPHLLINTGQTIKLSLKITTFNFKPKHLDFFADNEEVLTLSKAYEVFPEEDFVEGGGLSNFLKVTCSKEISENQYITVKSNDILVGKIKVVPNRIVSGPKIIFVAVHLDTIKFRINERVLTTRLFKQCAINLAISKDEFSLNLVDRENKLPQNFFHANDTINAYYYPEILVFLDGKFNELEGAHAYADFQKVYFINKKAKVVKPTGEIMRDDVSGYTKFPASKEKSSVVVFKSGFGGTTLAHELFHSLGLPHSFEKDPIGFTYHSFKEETTTNVMDYLGDGNSGRNLYHLWYWQVQKIRELANLL